MKYRILASTDTYHRLDVEADSESEAREKAEQIDLDHWTRETLIGAGMTIWECRQITDGSF